LRIETSYQNVFRDSSLDFRWEDNINIDMGLKQIGCERSDWIIMAEEGMSGGLL
jgi:hypothetical protein